MHQYIVVRADLDPAQQVLQGVHAALICRAVGEDDALVFLTIENERELAEFTDKIDGEVFAYRYLEDGVLNAVAFRDVHEHQRVLFRKLRMWKMPMAVAA